MPPPGNSPGGPPRVPPPSPLSPPRPCRSPPDRCAWAGSRAVATINNAKMTQLSFLSVLCMANPSYSDSRAEVTGRAPGHLHIIFANRPFSQGERPGFVAPPDD
jgi:hypothetical protein